MNELPHNWHLFLKSLILHLVALARKSSREKKLRHSFFFIIVRSWGTYFLLAERGVEDLLVAPLHDPERQRADDVVRVVLLDLLPVLRHRLHHHLVHQLRVPRDQRPVDQTDATVQLQHSLGQSADQRVEEIVQALGQDHVAAGQLGRRAKQLQASLLEIVARQQREGIAES